MYSCFIHVFLFKKGIFVFLFNSFMCNVVQCLADSMHLFLQGCVVLL